jgi:predicted transposase YbfD/YdcC
LPNGGKIEDQEPLLARRGFKKPYGPGKSTLYRVLSVVPVEVLVVTVSRWAEENLGCCVPLADGELEGVSLDGKTLRGSRKQGAAASHLLSALSHRLGLTLGQLGVDDKTNEIGVAPDLLADLVIEGRVFTMDALLTQREIAQTIVEGNGDYVMIAKDNQPTLRSDIALLFTDPNAAEFVEDQASTSKGHGRLEVRTLQTSSALNDYVAWPGLQQVFRLDRHITILKTGEVRAETVYGLTSLSAQRANASQLLTLARGHWNIENRSHWVRDVTFGEDQSSAQGQLASSDGESTQLRNQPVALTFGSSQMPLTFSPLIPRRPLPRLAVKVLLWESPGGATVCYFTMMVRDGIIRLM